MIAPGLPPRRQHLHPTAYQQAITPVDDEWAIRDGCLTDCRGADASTVYCHSVTPSLPRLMTESAHSGRFLHMKPVPTRAGVILSILPRYDAEKNIVASSELTISAHIYCSTDAPSETKSNERHRTSGVLSQEMLTPLRPLLIHFFKQEKMMMTHVLIATQAPKRPRNRVI